MNVKIELPYDAQIFIKSKFLKANIAEIEKEDNIFKVELDNKIFITFDESGKWISINSEKKLPETVIPDIVQKKISKLKRFETKYKNENLDINEIRRIINSYRVILDHYLEMHIYSN